MQKKRDVTLQGRKAGQTKYGEEAGEKTLKSKDRDERAVRIHRG